MNQVILNTEQYYPYGEIKDNRISRVSVRRLITFESQKDYHHIKDKIDVLKSLRLPGLVQLTRVLEDEGAFHLMYEYVPFKLKYQRFQHQQLVKELLQQISKELQLRRLAVTFEYFNIGVTQQNEIKYYLDIQHIGFSEDPKHILEQTHLFQINKVLDCLAREPSTARTEPMVQFEKEQIEARLTEMIPQVSNSPSAFRKLTNYKSMTSLKSLNISNPMDMLQKIEDRLTMLQKVTKKYTPAMRETFKSKEHLRETLKENWKTQKTQNRKMSDNTVYTSMFRSKGANTPEKKQQEFKEQELPSTGRLAEPLKFISPTSPPSTIAKSTIKPEVKKQKEPLSKRDFVELQKTEFENFFQSKEGYVHEFLNVLEDEQANNQGQQLPPIKQPYIQPSHKARQKKSNTIYDSPVQSSKQPVNPIKFNTILSNGRNMSSTRPAEHKNNHKSVQNFSKSEQLNNELKDRISIAIKKSDMAMIKFRKNSVQTQIGSHK